MIWKIESGESFPVASDVTSIAWSTVEPRLAFGTQDGMVKTIDVPTRASRLEAKLDEPVTALAFSHDGNLLAMASKVLRVWNLVDKSFVTSEYEHPQEVRTLAFSPDDKSLVSGCEDDKARLFRLNSEGSRFQPQFAPLNHLLHFESWLPPIPPIVTENRLLTSRHGLTYTNLTTGNRESFPPLRFPDFTAIASGPKPHQFFLGGHDKTGIFVDNDLVKDANSDSPVELGAVWFTTAAFSLDGTLLITGNNGGQAQLWSTDDALPRGPPILHRGLVRQVAFLADRSYFVTGQADGLIRVWGLDGGDRTNRSKIDMPGKLTYLKLSETGSLLLPCGASNWWGNLRRTRVFDAKEGRPLGPEIDTNGLLLDAAISHDESRVATVSVRGQDEKAGQYVPVSQFTSELQVWDWRTAERILGPIPLADEPRAVEFSPTNDAIAVISDAGAIQVFDSSSGELRVAMQHGPRHRRDYLRDPAMHRYQDTQGRFIATISAYLRFSRKDRWLLSWRTHNEQVHFWDAETGKSRYRPVSHDANVIDVALSRKEELIATGTVTGVAQVFEVANGRALSREMQHPDMIITISISPDDRLLVTTCKDGMIRVWDWRSNALVCPPFGFADELCVDAAFTPDGRWILACGTHQAVRVWEFATGHPVTPKYSLASDTDDWAITGQHLAITPTGMRAYAGGHSSSIHTLSLRRLVEPGSFATEDYVLQSEMAAGQRVERGGLVQLSTEEWLNRFREFHEQHPDHLAID